MSLWSLSAARKQEEVPATSKWIRNELFTLHDVMTNDVEQFAYSVASEFTWIDEQMHEILNDTNRNPRLLLESPTKLRGHESPLKRIRDEALNLKSPLKEIDSNVSKLSPIKLSGNRGILKDFSPPKTLDIPLLKSSNIPKVVLRKEEDEDDKKIQEVKSQKQKTRESESSNNFEIRTDVKQFERVSFNESPLDHELPRNSETNYGIEQNISTETVDTSVKRKLNFKDVRYSNAGPEGSDKSKTDQDGYDGDHSFQAIRSAIRKSISLKSKMADVNNTDSSDKSFKTSSEDAHQVTSLVAHSGHTPDNKHSSQASDDSFETLKVSSRESISVPLKDGSADSVETKQSTTPGRFSHRESQGFALLPHRGPLTVKSAKKKDNTKFRKSLFDDDYDPNKPKAVDSDIQKNRTENTEQGPPSRSLYPILNPQDSHTNTHTGDDSQTFTNQDAFVTEDASKLKPLKQSIVTDELEQEQKSPVKHQHSPSYSPLTSIFSSVGSTLFKAKMKFSKETESIKNNAENDVQEPKADSLKVQQIKLPPSPSKIPIPEKSTKHVELTSSDKVAEIEKKDTSMDVDKDEQKTKDADLVNEKNDRRSSIKFSPVKSIYGSLRRDMQETVQKPPVTAQLESSINIKATEKDKLKPKNLTRVSLSRPLEDKDHLRKSITRVGGLTSMSLDPKNVKKPRPQSFSNEQQIGNKRKTKTEEEISIAGHSNQPYRKIGAKIVPPSLSQVKQNTHEAKRRRTAEQIQTVLQKRAARTSNINQDNIQVSKNAEQITEVPKVSPPVQSQSKFTPTTSNQTLMKTAVLHHARLNNEKNPFQTSSNFGSSKLASKTPVTPTSNTVLPEIFSESDDDDEGSVLKDWANSPELRNILINQQHIDPDKVFGPIAPLQMEEIFRNSSTRLSRLKHRGSSAQWVGADALTVQEVENYKKRYKK